MSQQQGYQQQGAPGPVYDQQDQNYEDYETNNPPGVAPGPTPGPAAGRKNRRAYAGQAYEFGAGGNAALGGQQPPQQQPDSTYGGYSSQANAAGYAQGTYQQTPAAVQPSQTPLYGAADGASYGGYQAPGQAAAPGVAGMTQQFSQMDMAQRPGQPPVPQPGQQPQQPQGRAPVLNQLYPTDLQNQPFNVAELDFPPPPAVLPPNVSFDYSSTYIVADYALDFGHAITAFELSSQVRTINTKRRPNNPFPIEEVQTSLRLGHSTIYLSSR